MSKKKDCEVVRWVIKDWFFKKIRFLFVEDIDPNEDFYCGACGEPVLRRYLFCSEKCSEQVET